MPPKTPQTKAPKRRADVEDLKKASSGSGSGVATASSATDALAEDANNKRQKRPEETASEHIVRVKQEPLQPSPYPKPTQAAPVAAAAISKPLPPKTVPTSARLAHVPTNTMAAPQKIGVTNATVFQPVNTSAEISQMLARKQLARVRDPAASLRISTGAGTASAAVQQTPSSTSGSQQQQLMLGSKVFSMASGVASLPSARHISSYLQTMAPIEKLLREQAGYNMLPQDRQNVLLAMDATLTDVAAMFNSATKKRSAASSMPPPLSDNVTECLDPTQPMMQMPIYGPAYEDELLAEGGVPRPSPRSNFISVKAPMCTNGTSCHAFTTQWEWIPSGPVKPKAFIPMMWMCPNELEEFFMTGKVPSRGPGRCLVCCRLSTLNAVLLHQSDKTTPRGTQIQQWANSVGPGGYNADFCMAPCSVGFNGLYGPLALVSQKGIRACYDAKFNVYRLNQDLMKHEPIANTGSDLALRVRRDAESAASIFKGEAPPAVSTSVFRK